jgi:hypothetical protein
MPGKIALGTAGCAWGRAAGAGGDDFGRFLGERGPKSRLVSGISEAPDQAQAWLEMNRKRRSACWREDVVFLCFGWYAIFPCLS